MLNYDADESALAQFYGVSSLEEPVGTSGSALTVDQIKSGEVPIEEQFNELARLVQGRTLSNTEQIPSDLEDPLGLPRMVDHLVSQNIISSRQDPKLADFLISSKTFKPQQYLTTVHRESSINDLMRSLKFLEQNIQSQTSELRSVIDSNYLMFAEAKKAIDDVLVEFKKTKTSAQLERENTKVYNPQRQRRPLSGSVAFGSPALSGNSMGSSESSTELSQDLDESLTNLITQTSLMVKPLTDHREKERKLSQFIEFVDQNKFFFDLPQNFINSLRTHNHEKFVDDYQLYLTKREEVAKPINFALDKCFKSIDGIVSSYRKRVYKELLALDHEAGGPRSAFRNANNARFLSLVDKLHQITPGNESNPIKEFLSLQLEGLKKEHRYEFQQFERKFSSMQRKLQAYLEVTDHRLGGSNVSFIALKYSSVEKPDNEESIIDAFSSPDSLDIPQVSEAWLVLYNFINYLDGIFLRKMSKFVNNYSHYATQGVDNSGELNEIYTKFLISVTAKLTGIFEGTNNNDQISHLDSRPAQYSSFLPLYTNSLSAVYFLGEIQTKVRHILTRLGQGAVAVGGNHTNNVIKNLRSISSTISQRIMEAICAVWVNDCSQLYSLEQWELAEVNKKGTTRHTKCISEIESYEIYILRSLRKIVHADNKEEVDDGGVRIVSAHPSRRTLVSLEIQFIRSLNVLLDSISKRHAMEKDAKNPNPLFRILTLNNLDFFAQTSVPNIIAKFDKLFDKDLSNQTLKVYADIDAARLTFRAEVIDREKMSVSNIVSNHFSAPYRQKELQVDAFIYQVLVLIVKLIHVVKPLSGKTMLAEVIRELNEYFLVKVLEEFRTVVKDENCLYMATNLSMGIHFYNEIFGLSNSLRLDAKCTSIIEHILTEIDEVGNPTYSDAEFDLKLSNSLRDSQHEFDCFF